MSLVFQIADQAADPVGRVGPKGSTRRVPETPRLLLSGYASLTRPTKLRILTQRNPIWSEVLLVRARVRQLRRCQKAFVGDMQSVVQALDHLQTESTLAIQHFGNPAA